ncbi:MAG TPA: YggT family protein [Usitatibacter sp.]|nr:YggT family protein [Usitatibacter sp.]
MIAQVIALVLNTLASLFILTALVRFWMQVCRAPSRNPIAYFSMALTDWAVKPLRRVVPGLFKLDWSSFIVAWAFEYVLLLLLKMLEIGEVPDNPAAYSVLLFMSCVEIARYSIYVFMGAIIIQAVLSWVNPYHPVAPFFNAFANPLLKPVRRVVPLIGGVDISPVFVLLLLQILLMLPIAWLEYQGALMMARAVL